MDNTIISKNYQTDGGDTWVVGGKLVFDTGATIEGSLCANQAESTASTIAALKDDFNALLAKLKAAGLMEADADETAEETATE